MSFIDKLKSDGFPRAVADGKFGKDNVRFLDFRADDNATTGEHFCSTIHFGDVIIETDKGDQLTQSVVIKTLKNNEAVATPWLRLCNEYLFYTEVLPLLIKCDDSGSISEMFPKFFFGRLMTSSNDDFMNEYLVLENAQKRGFKLLGASQIFIDCDHLELMYRKMAQFHALSLICKQRYSKEFKEIASKIQDLILLAAESDELRNILQKNVEISFSNFHENPEYREKLLNVAAVVRDTNLSMRRVAAPVEPLTVICHGDLHKLNIFFRYDLDTKTPKELMFFDWAFIRQSSPAIDLATPLFFNASTETRASKWVELLKVYHSALTSCPGLDLQAVPSFNDLILDFKRRAFYGFVWGSSALNAVLITQGKNASSKETINETEELSEVEQIFHNIEKCEGNGVIFLKENMKFLIDEQFDFEFILNFRLSS